MNITFKKDFIDGITKLDGIPKYISSSEERGINAVRAVLDGVQKMGYSFIINDEVIGLVRSCVSHPMFHRKGYGYADTNLLLEYCDVVITDNRLQDIDDDGGEFALRILLVNGVNTYKVEMTYYNRSKNTTDRVKDLSRCDDLRLSQSEIRKILEKFSSEIDNMLIGDTFYINDADNNNKHYFTDNGVHFDVVAITLSNAPVACVRERTSFILYRIPLVTHIMEDKFGNKIDHNGEVIEENEEN